MLNLFIWFKVQQRKHFDVLLNSVEVFFLSVFQHVYVELEQSYELLSVPGSVFELGYPELHAYRMHTRVYLYSWHFQFLHKLETTISCSARCVLHVVMYNNVIIIMYTYRRSACMPWSHSYGAVVLYILTQAFSCSSTFHANFFRMEFECWTVIVQDLS